MENQLEEQNDFIKIILILKKNFMTLCIFVFLASVISIFVSLQMPNKYKSSVKIAKSSDESQQGLGALAGQFGGLANLAGISLGGGGDVNLIMDTLTSRSFIKQFIVKQDILAELFAVEYWDPTTNKLIYDDSKFNVASKKWVREVDFPKKPEPSLEEAYEKFKNILSVNLKRKTNLITVSITYYSPELAQKWLDLLIVDLSEYLRKQDQDKANESIKFLTDETSTSKIAGIQTVLSDLLEQQFQKKMLTQVRKYYGFDIRDHSYVPELKDSPKRALIVIGGAFFGGVLAILFIFMRLFIKAIKDA